MVYYESNYLCHYGLKGMKWGTRRWQFQDGRFNDAGKTRYFGQNSSHRPDSVRALQGNLPKQNRTFGSSSNEKSRQSFDKEKAKKIAKNIAIGAAIVGGTMLAVYGVKKVHELGDISGSVDTLKAGAQFLSEFNKTVQIFKSTNQKSERNAKEKTRYKGRR